MNKLLFVLFAFLLPISGFSQYQEPVYKTLATPVSTLAANSTNTTAGTIVVLPTSPTPVRIWLTASGIAATTNGVTAVSNLVVRLSTASGSVIATNTFDTASLSNLRLTIPTLGASTNTVSDYFELRGARYVRVGQIENNFQGAVSNLALIIAYPQ
jgi:hypothetical protein